MLPGIAVRQLRRFPDDRGIFTEIMRSDWDDVFKDEARQANYSVTHPGVVRAWHRHERGQVDAFVVERYHEAFEAFAAINEGERAEVFAALVEQIVGA